MKPSQRRSPDRSRSRSRERTLQFKADHIKILKKKSEYYKVSSELYKKWLKITHEKAKKIKNTLIK